MPIAGREEATLGLGGGGEGAKIKSMLPYHVDLPACYRIEAIVDFRHHVYFSPKLGGGGACPPNVQMWAVTTPFLPPCGAPWSALNYTSVLPTTLSRQIGLLCSPEGGSGGSAEPPSKKWYSWNWGQKCTYSTPTFLCSFNTYVFVGYSYDKKKTP